MAGRPKVIQDSKVFDVSKPSRSKPVSTSRPVITQHKDVVDATVNQEPAVETEAKLSAPSVSKKIIQPLDDAAHEAAEPIEVMQDEVDQEVDEVTKTAPEVPQADAVVKEVPVAVTEPKPEPEETVEADVPKEEETPKEPAATEQPKVEAPEEEAAEEPDEPQETEETSEVNTETATVEAMTEAAQSKKANSKTSAANSPAVQELIDSKKYFVPLAHESGSKGSHRGLLVILLLIILVGGLYLAVDSELLSLDIKLPYEFIK